MLLYLTYLRCHSTNVLAITKHVLEKSLQLKPDRTRLGSYRVIIDRYGTGDIEKGLNGEIFDVPKTQLILLRL